MKREGKVGPHVLLPADETFMMERTARMQQQGRSYIQRKDAWGSWRDRLQKRRSENENGGATSLHLVPFLCCCRGAPAAHRYNYGIYNTNADGIIQGVRAWK